MKIYNDYIHSLRSTMSLTAVHKLAASFSVQRHPDLKNLTGTMLLQCHPCVSCNETLVLPPP